MKSSSKRKALDVPAPSTASQAAAVEAEAISPKVKRTVRLQPHSQGPARATEALEPEFDEADEAVYAADWEAVMADDEDLWAEDFEDDLEDEDAIADDDYFAEEFELGRTEDADYAFFEPEMAPRASVQLVLERGMVKALATKTTGEFLAQLLQTLNQASRAMRIAQQPASGSRRPRTVKRNGHHPGLKSQVLTQPLQTALPLLTVLTQRYAQRGLSEFEVLEDTIACLSDEDAKILAPLLAGLAARMAIAPQMPEAVAQLTASQRQQLLNAATKAVVLLNRQAALPILPGLAATIARHAVQRQRPLAALPSDFYAAAIRAASHPQMQEKLLNFQPEVSPQPPSPLPPQVSLEHMPMPLQVRIEGPIELLLKRVDGQ